MGRKNEFAELKALGLYAADTVGNGLQSKPLPLTPLKVC